MEIMESLQGFDQARSHIYAPFNRVRMNYHLFRDHRERRILHYMPQNVKRHCRSFVRYLCVVISSLGHTFPSPKVDMQSAEQHLQRELIEGPGDEQACACRGPGHMPDNFFLYLGWQ